MRLGMTLPVTEPGWSREVLSRWVRNVDRGPFSTLAFGERIAFPSPDMVTTLGACAALTERVRIMTTVAVAPIHAPLMLAKQLATADVFSGGRLTVGVARGGRREDYLAAGLD